jgi:hypothetical protein
MPSLLPRFLSTTAVTRGNGLSQDAGGFATRLRVCGSVPGALARHLKVCVAACEIPKRRLITW